jgi:hypothetical protein
MKLKSFVATGTIGLLAIIGAVQVVRWACSLMAVALTYWGGWGIAEAMQAAPWIIVASTAGLTMSFYGMHEDNKRYKRSGYGKIVRNHARTVEPEYRQNRRDA